MGENKLLVDLENPKLSTSSPKQSVLLPDIKYIHKNQSFFWNNKLENNNLNKKSR